MSSKNKVTVKQNSYLLLEGDFKVKNIDGTITMSDKKVYLCGCGKSDNKPFCDGAHKR